MSGNIPSTYDYLKPNSYLLAIDSLPYVSYTCQRVNVPGLSLGTATQPTPFVDVPRTGDKIRYDNFEATFLVSEDMTNYIEMLNWMRGIGFPNSHDEFASFVASRKRFGDIDKDDDLSLYSDATLTLHNANNNPYLEVKLKQLVPIALSSIEMSATESDIRYFTATATFAIQDYTIERVSRAT